MLYKFHSLKKKDGRLTFPEIMTVSGKNKQRVRRMLFLPGRLELCALLVKVVSCRGAALGRTACTGRRMKIAL